MKTACSVSLLDIKVHQDFPVREEMILNGIRLYMKCTVGEYFTSDQIERFCNSLSSLRNRPAECSFPHHLCHVVTNQGTIRSRFIQRKVLRKDELSILIYNLAPYAFLSRKEAAQFAKDTFPYFFSSPATIYSTFTKYLNAPVTETGREVFFTIVNFPFHSTNKLEEEMIRLSVEINNSKL